jgi:Na+/melibiose symporter-like transporter
MKKYACFFVILLSAYSLAVTFALSLFSFPSPPPTSLGKLAFFPRTWCNVYQGIIKITIKLAGWPREEKGKGKEGKRGWEVKTRNMGERFPNRPTNKMYGKYSFVLSARQNMQTHARHYMSTCSEYEHQTSLVLFFLLSCPKVCPTLCSNMLTCFLHVPLFLYTIMSLPYHHRRGKKI